MADDEPSAAQLELRRRIVEIERDTTLSAAEKAERRQQVMSAGFAPKAKAADKASAAVDAKGKGAAGPESTLAMIDEALKCAFCFNLCERPVTAPCQHNFCLGCFTKWVQQSKTSCPTCRAPIPQSMRQNPRINSALVNAIRMAKRGERPPSAAAAAAKLANDARPDEAFVTERAVRAGKANASSGRIFVTVPQDHFGPIPASADPTRNRGVLVGDSWADRLECRQWGAHFPHVAGIAGQSGQGSQSVALSGGYEDDEDNGEWFLYTGSGGRDLSGNKRTSKTQSFDQTFDKSNKALKVSCMLGLPVRVVRSHKEKRSSYAPLPTAVRYDGIYRIEKCWRHKGTQGQLMCRYLFVRCDNEPAPWTTDEHGDRPRPLPVVAELKTVTEVFECTAQKWWDFDAATKEWGWTRPAPESQKPTGEPKKKKLVTEQQRLLKEFGCKLCGNILSAPLSTPCGHTFCKACLETKFVGIADTRERAAPSGRAMREAKIVKPCPQCKFDLAEFMKGAQVNMDMASIIGNLQRAAAAHGDGGAGAGGSDDDEGEEEEEEEAGGAGPSPAAPVPRAAVVSEQAKRAAAVDTLCQQFPAVDRALIESFMDDQGNDVRDVAVMLRSVSRPDQPRAAKKAAPAAAEDGAETAEGGAGPAPSKRAKR